MPKKSNPHPHVSWRRGRPRFQPAATLRAMGYEGQNLQHPDGTWYTKGEAVDWSAELQREIEARRFQEKGAARSRPARKVGPTYTVGRLFEDWFRSPKFGASYAAKVRQVKARELKGGAKRRQPGGNQKIYAENTIRDYKQKARALEDHDPELYASEVDALDRVICYGLYEDLWAERGLATARGVLATLSAAISWGLNRGKFKRLQANPALGLGMTTPAPRVRFASREEFETLVAAADALGMPEMGDMFTLAVWTGQRQSDRLELVDRGLVNNRRGFRQRKTGRGVAIYEAPELKRRLEAAQARRQAVDVASRHVILDEATWQPFKPWPYRHRFKKVLAAAIAGVVDEEATAAARAENRLARRTAKPPTIYLVEPCPSLQGFFEMDFRDTAVVWMALAGSTIPEIISVTGHSMSSATQVLKHYLAAHPEMADSAIGKMVAWYDAGGETETGL